jgi:hypothetical protein
MRIENLIITVGKLATSLGARRWERRHPCLQRRSRRNISTMWAKGTVPTGAQASLPANAAYGVIFLRCGLKGTVPTGAQASLPANAARGVIFAGSTVLLGARFLERSYWERGRPVRTEREARKHFLSEPGDSSPLARGGWQSLRLTGGGSSDWVTIYIFQA